MIPESLFTFVYFASFAHFVIYFLFWFPISSNWACLYDISCYLGFLFLALDKDGNFVGDRLSG